MRELEKDAQFASVEETYSESREEFLERYSKEKNVPVRPSDKGLYDDYSKYRNEHWKIEEKRRKDFAFPFADGNYGIVKPGDMSPVDGKTVTKEDIAYLHRGRDRDVYSNNKFRHKDITDYDLLERLDLEEEKRRRHLPNDYETVAEEFKRARTVIDQGALVNDGEGITDRILCPGHIPTPEEALGLEDSPLKDAFEEVFQSLTNSEQHVFDLVFMQGNTRTAAAKMLGVSEGTVRNRIKSIKEKLGENPVITRHLDIFSTSYERITEWEEKQKERKKRYEKSHKEYLDRKRAEGREMLPDEEDPDDIRDEE